MATQTLEFNKIFIKLKYNKLSGVTFGIFRLGDVRYRTSEMSWMSYLGKMCLGVGILRPILHRMTLAFKKSTKSWKDSTKSVAAQL